MSEALLISVSSRSSFSCLEALAKNLLLKEYKIVFCFDFEDKSLQKRVGELGADYIEFQKYVNESIKRKSLFRYKKNRLLVEFCNIHYRNIEASKLILRKHKPALIIVAEDGITGNMWLISTARRLKIQVLDTPYSFGSQRDLESDLLMKKARGELITVSGEYGRIIRKKYPHWIKKGNFENSLMFSQEYIISLEKMGITVNNPWTIHGGEANKIAVESEKMYIHYLNEGIFPSKLSLVGTVYCDLLYKTIYSNKKFQAAFENSLPIEDGKRSLLVCWPPNYDHERKTEFGSYINLTQALMEYLLGIQNLKVTVSLHPAVEDSIYNTIKNMGVEVSNDNIFELIPKHDVYFSCFSSTIRYAIACAKPVINYDMYQFNFVDYNDEPGVQLVKSFAQFKETLAICMKNEKYNRLALLQKQSSVRWGQLDGNNFDRLLGLIQKMSSSYFQKLIAYIK